MIKVRQIFLDKSGKHVTTEDEAYFCLMDYPNKLVTTVYDKEDEVLHLSATRYTSWDDEVVEKVVQEGDMRLLEAILYFSFCCDKCRNKKRKYYDLAEMDVRTVGCAYCRSKDVKGRDNEDEGTDIDVEVSSEDANQEGDNNTRGDIRRSIS